MNTDLTEANKERQGGCLQRPGPTGVEL